MSLKWARLFSTAICEHAYLPATFSASELPHLLLVRGFVFVRCEQEAI